MHLCQDEKDLIRRLTNIPIETLDHLIDLKLSWRVKQVLNAKVVLFKIEWLFSKKNLDVESRAVCELSTPINQKLEKNCNIVINELRSRMISFICSKIIRCDAYYRTM